MTYSCTDFVDSILDALGIVVPDDAQDDPSAQADLALAAIAALKSTASLGPIVVAMEGGLVSSVATYDQRLIDVDVLIIDYDVEGADESEIRTVKQHDGRLAEALLGEDRIALATIDIDALLADEESDEIDYEATARFHRWEGNDDSGWHHKAKPGIVFATAREVCVYLEVI